MPWCQYIRGIYSKHAWYGLYSDSSIRGAIHLSTSLAIALRSELIPGLNTFILQHRQCTRYISLWIKLPSAAKVT